MPLPSPDEDPGEVAGPPGVFDGSTCADSPDPAGPAEPFGGPELGRFPLLA
ncbi:MAG: hypothetical protein ACLQBX_08435 [Candidatus Limnocylindrales bacterium]